MIKRRRTVNYEVFLPVITATIREKEKSDQQLTDSEFKAVVAVAFRDAVIRFMKDTKLYRREIPIDVWKGVTRYDIVPPEGFYVESAIELKTGNSHLPGNYSLDERELILNDCCPRHDMEKAWYVEAAIVPKVTLNPCEFDEEFINRHYEAILTAMEIRLFGMTNRTWGNPSMVSYKETEYRHQRNRAVRGGTDSSKPVRVRYTRLSNAMCGQKM